MKIIPFLFAYVKILFYICSINNTKNNIMSNLESIYNQTLERKQNDLNEWRARVKLNWDNRLAGAKLVEQRIAFLRDKGYSVSIQHDHEFNFELGKNGSFPNVRVNGTTMINKSGIEGENIHVSGFHKFSLMGDSYTFEGFVKKLIS